MKLYLISGKIKSGKDTVGNLIIDCYKKHNLKACIIPMSGPLRTYAKDYFGWDGKEETKPRELLQQLGTEVIRKKLGKENFLINRIIDDIEILSLYYDVIIITGIRRVEEISALKNKFEYSINIHLIRDDVLNTNLTIKEKEHYTEHALDNYHNYDYLIKNKTIEEIKNIISNIIEKEVNINEKND